jgi:DNA-binding response OmpR family regulator
MGLEELKEKNIKAEPIRVLIADDDTPTRILLRAAVSQWGYEVIEAADGEEAWNILQKPDIPQLMIVDWLMPKLDGIDLCRRVKKEIEHYPYIILLTQLSGTTNIVKGLEAGADEFLSKPFNMAELQSRLSVGARIIHYKSKLARKNMELHDYFLQSKDLACNVSSIAYKLEEIINECVSLGVGNTNGAQLDKLRKLQSDLKCTTEKIENLNNVHEEEGDDA